MCKHVAATLYGIGARLDQEAELFFRLRRVDQTELLTEAGRGTALAAGQDGKRRRIAESALADVFGIEIDAPAGAALATASPPRAMRGPTVRPAARDLAQAAEAPEPGAPRARGRRREVRGRIGARSARRRAPAARRARGPSG
jgi:hypothetical protein